MTPPWHPGFWQNETLHVAAAGPALAEAAELSKFTKEREETRHLLFFQTSGSEGGAKWVGLSRGAMLASAQAVNRHLEAGPGDRWLIALPLHHVGGFSILARCQQNGAGWFHWREKWHAARLAALCAEQRITLLSLVPTQVFDLVQQGLAAPPGLRAVVVGGGALEAGLGKAAQALGWPLLQSYGMTEAASQIATEPLAHGPCGFEPDCLEVLPGWDLRVNTDGRLILRGPALADGYALKQNGAWTWLPLHGELQTRDFGWLWHQEGRAWLKVLGRESGFVKVKGELVNVPALQSRVDEQLGAGCTAIVPLPDPRRDTKLVLAVERARVTQDTIEHWWQAWHDNALPPEKLQAWRWVEAIPRSDLGKVRMEDLKRLIKEG